MQEQIQTQSSTSKNTLPIIPKEYRDTSLVKLGPILEAEAKYGPIFRRDLFDAAYAALKSMNAHERDDHGAEEEGDGYIYVPALDIYGAKCKIKTWRNGAQIQRDGGTCVMKQVWIYNSIQRLGHIYGGDSSRQLCSYSFAARVDTADRQNCFVESTLLERTEVWTEEWNNSDICHQLTAFLVENAGKSMQHVDKIVCFGLGCFPTEWERSIKASYFQHLAACTVREIIATNQSDNDAPKIFAQDPVYCASGTSYLSRHLDISVLDDPEGFKALHGNTFVLSFSCNVPARQIVLGLTHEWGGPAGIFCNAIKSEGLGCDGKGCDDRGASPYMTCEPSPGLWKFKQDGIWMECGDKEGQNCFGKVGVYLKRREGL